MKYQYLSNNKITITESGVYTLGLVLILTTVGFIIQSNLVYLVTAGLIALLITDLILSFFSLKGVKISRFCPTHALRDEEFKIKLKIENTLFTKFLLKISDCSFTENIPGVKFPAIAELKKGESVVLSYIKQVKARGEYYLNYVVIESSFPLGLWKIQKNYPSKSKLTVYPEFYEIPQFAVSFRGMRAEFANTASNRPGTGGNFLQIREFQTGDSLKNIHWRATARTGKLMVRELEKFTLSNLSIVLDSSSNLILGLGEESNFEYAIRAAATIANKALSTRYHVKFIYYDQIKSKIKFVKAYGRMTPILNHLSMIDITDKIKVKDLVEASIPEIERESVAVFVLLSLTSDVTRIIMRLAEQGIESVLVVFDPKSFAEVVDQKIGDFYSVFSKLMSGEIFYLAGEGVRVYVVRQGDYISDALSRPRMFVTA